MTLRNSPSHYGSLSIFLHWGLALLIFGLFGLGLYMVELTYYDTNYRSSMDLHKSLGIIMLSLLIIRLVWRMSNPKPQRLSNTPDWQHKIAELLHSAFYLLLFSLAISGYLISTADGRPLVVFDALEIPSLLQGDNQEDIAGEIHEILAWTLISFAALHALAALKHHFIDNDETLRRILPFTRK